VENEANKPQTIILTFVREPWQLTIDGETENLNVAMAMLDEAKRVMETKWRIAAALEAQEENKRRLEGESRLKSVLGRVPVRRS
jgi:hypothetical protein